MSILLRGYLSNKNKLERVFVISSFVWVFGAQGKPQGQFLWFTTSPFSPKEFENTLLYRERSEKQSPRMERNLPNTNRDILR